MRPLECFDKTANCENSLAMQDMSEVDWYHTDVIVYMISYAKFNFTLAQTSPMYALLKSATHGVLKLKNN